MLLRKTLLALSASLPLFGNTVATELTEDDFLSEEPIIVSSATRLNQEPRNIPVTMTVIDRKMIEASSATTVVELMRLVPGFQVGSRYGNESTVTYHGLSSETNTRLHVLIDGRSVYDPMFGGALWHTIPLTMDEIQSIEVIRGPNAAAYGANSFSGVINIKTFGSDALKGTRLSAMYGHERDLGRVSGMYSGNSDNLNYRVTLEYEDNAGFEDAKLDRFPYNANWHDDMSRLLLNSRFDFQDGNVSHLFEFGIIDSKLGTGLEDATSIGIPPTNEDLLSFYENYIWKHQISLLEKQQFQVSHTYIDSNNTLQSADGDHKDAGRPDPPTLTPPPDTADGQSYPFDNGDHFIYEINDFTSHRLDLEYEYSHILSPTLQYVWGAGIRYDYGKSTGYFNGADHERLSGRLFGHLEWKATPRLIFNAGGLLESYQHIGEYFSPRTGLNYHLNDQQTVKANWSSAYRVPSLLNEYALFYNYDTATNAIHEWLDIGNQDLKPELIRSVELGYLGQFFNNRLGVDLRLAKEFIDDAIDRRKTDNGKRRADIPRWRTLNFGAMDVESAELALSFKPSPQTFIQASASYANAWGYRSYETADNTNTSLVTVYNVDEYVPLFSSGILMSHQFTDSFKASAQYSFVREYTTSGLGDPIERMETIDLKFSKTFNNSGTPIEIIATVKNITDNEYQDFDIDNLVGMESYIEIKTNLY